MTASDFRRIPLSLTRAGRVCPYVVAAYRVGGRKLASLASQEDGWETPTFVSPRRTRMYSPASPDRLAIADRQDTRKETPRSSPRPANTKGGKRRPIYRPDVRLLERDYAVVSFRRRRHSSAVISQISAASRPAT